MSEKCKNKIGTVMPDEYDWRGQFREMCKDIYFKGTVDTGKVWGLCVEIDTLNADLTELCEENGRIVDSSMKQIGTLRSQLSLLEEVVEAAYREGHANGHRSGTDDAGWSSPAGRHVDDDWKDSDALAKLKESER